MQHQKHRQLRKTKWCDPRHCQWAPLKLVVPRSLRTPNLTLAYSRPSGAVNPSVLHALHGAFDPITLCYRLNPSKPSVVSRRHFLCLVLYDDLQRRALKAFKPARRRRLLRPSTPFPKLLSMTLPEPNGVARKAGLLLPLLSGFNRNLPCAPKRRTERLEWLRSGASAPRRAKAHAKHFGRAAQRAQGRCTRCYLIPNPRMLNN